MKIFVFLFVLMSGINTLFAQIQDTSIIVSKDTIEVKADKYLHIPNINSIASKISIPIHKTPASVGVVTSNVMLDQNAVVLSDALRNISGINVQGNLGTNDYFLIRGFESSGSGLILTDGIQSPDISMYEIYGFGFYDMYNIERVEVLKGPASFLYGANTLSGAVNLLRKLPIPRNFANLSVRMGDYRLKRGTFDTGITSEDKKIMFRFNGLLQHSEQYRKGKYSKSKALNPSITWKINRKATLNLNFEYVNSLLIPDAGIPLYIPDGNWLLPDVALDISFQTPLDESNQEIYKLYIDYGRKIGSSIEVKSKIFYKNIDGHTDITVPHNPHPSISGAWILERHIYSFSEEQNILGAQNEALFKYVNAGFRNDFLIGFESSILESNATRTLSQIPATLLFYHKESVKNTNDVFKLNDISCNSKIYTLSPYFVNYMHFSESFQMLFGGRYDMLNFETDRQNAPFDYFTMSLSSIPESLKKSYDKFSPMLGLVYKESENLWFYANVGKSFSRGKRIIDDPINSTQFEIGYKYKSKDGKIRNSFAIYNLEKENIAIPLQGPLQGFAHSPTGNQRSQGLEFEISTKPTDDWYFSFAYTYTIADLLKYNALFIDEYFKIGLDDFSNNSPAFIPAHLLNIWSTKELYKGFGIGAGIKYVGKQYAYIDNEFEIDGYFLYDMTLFYHSDQWEFRVNIKNITGKKYLTRGFGPYSVIPAGGTNMSGGINFIL
jgi:iron complex outermembrane recepter protein